MNVFLAHDVPTPSTLVLRKKSYRNSYWVGRIDSVVVIASGSDVESGQQQHVEANDVLREI